jgi:hypothetical protein
LTLASGATAHGSVLSVCLLTHIVVNLSENIQGFEPHFELWMRALEV